MAKRTKKIPVSMRALTSRINRVLKRDDEVLRAARGARAKQEFGCHFIVNFAQNLVVSHHVDPEALGRKLAALSEWEMLMEE